MNVEAGEIAESSARRIEREIRKAIITLNISPGSPLSEQEIAERYAVSRQPVREAFIALARAGLVEILPRRGTFVVKISLDRMLEARFIRETIEAGVVRRACERFDARVRTRIDFYLDAQQVAAEAGQHYEFQRADERFHAALAEGAGCPTAWSVIDDIKAHMDRVCHLTLPSATALPRLVEQHRAILAGIDARDPDRAEAELKAHLSEILKALPQVRAAHSDLFI
ncbi:GntR family transcriptional regulator [Ancylobacter defluvii]|uniref:GntR family transcriptional regulator n=1 Tax=Ancylobacter defluvii TaxID=1282440 RepID=A0A9W6K102_9HYPH|nr:GntR family transcriptional regulator [Ancylobacter defluvii]MBS7588840.1 GntR family transcriptional regulator [Ancylobacter defluvii]GLK86932.1 GntR family transcriptional regulator [Ancylobacter defluvii]